MEKIAAIVEGHTEEHFIRATYASVHITRPIPNGRTVTTEVVIEAIIDALELIGGNISKVVVLLDREQRDLDAEAFIMAIRNGITPRCGARAIYIGVADRQIENWIIADEQEMRSRFDRTFKYPGDGCAGKTVLQSLSGGTSRGPRDTALLLKSCSATRSAGNSPSLSRFIQAIDFDWVWATS